MLKLIEPEEISPNKVNDKNLERALHVLKQAEKAQLSLINESDEYKKVVIALAALGEPGRDIFVRLIATNKAWNKEIAVHDFNFALASGKAKSPAKFFDIAAKAGLTTKVPMGLRESKQKIAARDFLGSNTDDWLKYRVWQEDGMYWGADERTYKPYEITNFTMKFLFFTKKSKTESFRLIHLKNIHGQTASIFVNTDETIAVGSLKKILEREGVFRFKGSDTDLGNIKDMLQQDEKQATLVTRLGWHDTGFYAFSNGVYDVAGNQFIPVDEYGIFNFDTRQKDGSYQLQHYFIPARAEMFNDQDDSYTNDKKFFYSPLPKVLIDGVERQLTFEMWSYQFALVYGRQGQMIMTFAMMCIFSDIIFINTGRRFPIFSVYGPPFSGKGTVIESSLRLLGTPQDQIMLDGVSTDKGVMRTFSQYSNGIVWLDEYSNSLRPTIMGCLKNLFDRKGYVTAKKDNSFETRISPVLSGCFMSGQEMPTINPALFSRVILTTKTQTEYSEAERYNFSELEKMEADGLAGITTHLLQHRKFFEENFKQVFLTEYKALALAINNNKVGVRLLSNYASLIATAAVLAQKVTLPFAMEDFRELCKATLLDQFFVQKASNDVSKFWDILQDLFNEGFVKEGVHFKQKNGILYLRVDDIYQQYSEAMIKRKDPTGLEKETLKSYLKMDPKIFIKSDRTWIGPSQYRVMQFAYPELGIDLIRGDSKEEVLEKRKEMKVKADPEDDDDDDDIF